MRILGLDTATRATTVAVLDTDVEPAGPVFDGPAGAAIERRDDPPPGARPRHTTRLLELAVEALDAAGADWGDLDLIAVGTGPGTFTGLRIGVATARALATAHELPLVGVSTLRSLAHGAAGRAAEEGRAPLAVLDARRGEAFAAGWAADGADEPRLRPSAVAPATLADALAREPRAWLAVGEGAVEFRTALEDSGVLIPEDGSELHRVSAIHHCRLATGLPPQNPDDVSPEYLRLPDAELARRGRTA